MNIQPSAEVHGKRQQQTEVSEGTHFFCFKHSSRMAIVQIRHQALFFIHHAWSLLRNRF